MPYFLLLLAVAAGILGFRHWSKYRTRQKHLASMLSDHQRALVAQQVPLVEKLPYDLRLKLEGKINAFLHQVEFVGCDGLEVSEEMRLSIAAQACLLIVNCDMWYNLSTVFIYEGAFKSQKLEHDGLVVTERETVRLGESWSRGPVILSWQDSEHGAINHKDGHNVVFHEFAHQIDDLSGQTDGVPVLNRGQSYADWERAFVAAYQRHQQNVENGYETVLDAYGAQGPQEFFAVAVEVFFEKPAELKCQEAEIYGQLSRLLQLDPLSWR